VRPGLTGPWWLLSGTRQLSIAAEVAVDLSYIRHYSIWSDLHILAATARRLCARQQGARPRPEAHAAAAEIVNSTRATVP